MIRFLFLIVHHLLPPRLKDYLRRQGWLRRANIRVWKLPAPLSGLRMEGPGVFGTYVEKPYEPLVCQSLVGLVRPGWIAVDVGAHLGYFTLLLARLVGENGKVFSFEDCPENVHWLRENVALNGFVDRVVIEDLAVTDGRQAIIRLNAPLHYTSEWSIIRASPVSRSIEVKAISLDQYFAQGSAVNFIKMDIEGAEYLALQGARSLLQRDRPVCLVELHGEEGQMAAAFLKEIGYRITDLKGHPLSGPAFPSHILAQPEIKD